MAWKTSLRLHASRQIASWNLSDFVWTDVLMHLHQVLPQAPSAHLRRVRQPFDGMVYEFSLIDPEDRMTT